MSGSVVHVLIRKTGSLFVKTGNLLIGTAFKLHESSESVSDANKKRWYAINGDATLRVNYNLNQDSIVFDIGGFKGEWCAEIAARYSPAIFVFEPVKEFFNSLQNRFANNKNIKIFPFGLSSIDSQLEIAVMSEASSTFRSKNNTHEISQSETIQLKNINSFIRENSIAHIDLMKINIEGGEYDLLESLISSGGIKNIDNIQVQFHDFVDNAEMRMNNLKKKLSQTHELTYEYIFVWENWKRKNNQE